MKNIALTLTTVLAIILCAFAFYFGVYPKHDVGQASFLLLWAIVVAVIVGPLCQRGA